MSACDFVRASVPAEQKPCLSKPPPAVTFPEAEACEDFELCFTLEQAVQLEKAQVAWENYGRAAWAGCSPTP